MSRITGKYKSNFKATLKCICIVGGRLTGGCTFLYAQLLYLQQIKDIINSIKKDWSYSHEGDSA